MNGFLIFLVIALWFGIRVRKIYRSPGPSYDGESGDGPIPGTVKGSYEARTSPFRTSAEKARSSAASSFSKEEEAAGYFTYETLDGESADHSSASDIACRTAVNSNRKVDNQMSEEEDAAESQVIDLRQAVIYQTILTNKYCSDRQFYEIN